VRVGLKIFVSFVGFVADFFVADFFVADA